MGYICGMFLSMLTICVCTFSGARGRGAHSRSTIRKKSLLESKTFAFRQAEIETGQVSSPQEQEHTEPFNTLPANNSAQSRSMHPPHTLYTVIFVCKCVCSSVCVCRGDRQQIPHNLVFYWSASPHFYLLKMSVCFFFVHTGWVLPSGIPVGVDQDAVQCIICLSVKWESREQPFFLYTSASL